MIHGYPFTDYHELSLDYLMRLARESLGLHLETSGKFLKLVNANGDDISKLLVTYADMARVDDEGNTISAFIFNAGVDGNTVVFTKGNGEVTTITVPYSVKAEKDMNNNAITSYVHDVDVNGDNLIVTFGDNTSSVITVPFATKARDDVNGKAITSYTATIVPVGDKLAIKDGNNNTIAEITVPYSVKASNDEDNDNIKTTYGHSLSTGATTVKLLNKTGTMLNEITVPYAVQALTDTDGNALLSDYGYHLAVNGRKIAIDAHNGATLNEITVPFATLSSNAENGIESVDISGDTIVFTTYAGQTFSITSPYSVKALKDSLNNTFISSYISQVTNDNNTGKISFFSPDGTKLAEITPTVNKAVNDSFNNRIADYIKTIATNPNSDYMTVTHGTGETDSITIHYATHAWKDTYDNVIGNTYIKGLEIITVDDDKYLVAYNGEDSELFRIPLDDFEPEFGLVDSIVIEYQNGNIVDIHWYNKATTVNVSDLLYYMESGYPVMIYDRVSHTNVFINYKAESTSTPLYIAGIFFNANDTYTVTIDLTNMTISIEKLSYAPIIVVFDESNNTITSITLKGESEQLSANEVKALFNKGHAIYASASTSSNTGFIPVYEYVDTASNTVVKAEQTVITWVSGNASIIGRVRYQFNLDNLTFTNNLIPIGKPIPNAIANDTPTGTINAGDSLIRTINIGYTRTLGTGNPSLVYCCPQDSWNDDLLVVNARIQQIISDTQLVVKYKIYNPTSTTQTLSGYVTVGLYT